MQEVPCFSLSLSVFWVSLGHMKVLTTAAIFFKETVFTKTSFRCGLSLVQSPFNKHN